MKKIKILMAACAVLLVVCAACNKSDNGASAAKGKPGGQPAAQIFAVTTISVEASPISAYLTLAGDLVSGSSVDAYSEAAGKITRVNVNVGSRVTRGQAIAVVDPSKPGMNFVAHTVRAPIAGTVTALPAEVGMTISVATPLAKIAGGGGLEIVLYVPERYISSVRLGLPCEISFDAYPAEVFRGIVNEVSPTVDAATRTEMIKINVDNSGARLKAGMFAKVHVVTESREKALCVPTSAVVTRQGKTVVFVAAPGAEGGTFIVHQVEVVTGIESEGYIELKSGVSLGDEVVDKGMSLLTEGTRVNIISRNAGRSEPRS